MGKVSKVLNEVDRGDLVVVSWFDASVGKSLGIGQAVDVPVKSWGVYIGVLGKKQQHIIIAQNYFEYSNGLYDLDYIAVPVTWAVQMEIVKAGFVESDVADRLYNSFLHGHSRTFRHRQQKVRNHGG